MARLNRIPFDIWIQYSQRRMILWLFCLRNLERRFPPGANWVTILRGEDSTIPYRGRRFLWRNWCIAFISSIKSCRAPISTLSPNFKFKNKLNNYKLKVLDNYAFYLLTLRALMATGILVFPDVQFPEYTTPNDPSPSSLPISMALSSINPPRWSMLS